MQNFDSKEDFKIIELCLDHVDSIVDIHNVAFNGFFLTSLGPNFLKTYYSSCLRNKSTIAIGIIDHNENILGFAFGTINSLGYHRDILLRNFCSFTFDLFNVFISNPFILLRLLFNLNKSPNVKDKNNYAELLSIAVLPKYKGSGFGKIILDHFEKSIKNRDVCKIALTTDYYENDSVIRFYQNSNYRIFYDFMAYPHRRMYKMIKEL